MRLDHLLSREEKVGVVLLLCYQGITKAGEAAEEGRLRRHRTLLVAIRLGDTPVGKLVYFYIPNTKVKP